MDEIIENEEAAIVDDNINDDIAKAMEELETPRDEAGKFKAEEATPAEDAPAVEPIKEVPPAPQSWGTAVKSKWNELPEDVRAEVLKRENDMHQVLTRHDGDLRLGREMKEAVAPYVATIIAEGGTPVTAVRDLLNTAYVLRTGTPEQKKAIIFNTAKQFNIDIGVANDDYEDPTIASLKQQIEELRNIANPQVIESRLREQLESDKIQSEIAAFASQPEHAHFQTVRPLMVAMLNAGQAKDLKEAYDKACWADPQIRSTLEAARSAEIEAKRKQEIADKKRAAASVSGSPAIPSNAKATNPKSSVEDDLRAAFDELENKI